MFYSLLKIGEITDHEFMFEKIKKEGDICFVIFDNDNKNVTFERIRLGDGDEKKYAYIGDATASKPQDSITTRYPDRIFGFYISKGKRLPANKFALKVVANKLKGTQTGRMLEKVLNWYKPEEWKEKILSEKNQWKDCVLYTVKVKENNREIEIATEEDYRNSIIFSGETEPGTCQFCGKSIVLKNPDYPNGTLLKIFIVDKKGFLPGLAESAIPLAHSVCPECREKLVRGDRYVEQNLNSKIRDLNIYVIPEMSTRATKEFLGKFKINNEGYIFERLHKLSIGERTAEQVAGEIEDPRLTFVIGNKENAKFRIKKVIPEVRYLRLVETIKAFRIAESVIFNNAKNHCISAPTISFGDLYDILPVEKKGGKDPKYFIEFFESMLLQVPLSKSYVYSVFLRSLRCNRYKTCVNSNTNTKDLECVSLLAETYIYAMAKLNVMDINVKYEEASDPISYAKNLGLNEGLIGVFLLGVLTAYVGTEQYKKGDEKKAILNKIDFEGMDTNDIIVYSNRLFESLKNYKLLNSYVERLFYDATSRIVSGNKDLGDPQQNVFYLLLGYSYQTYQAINNKIEVNETQES
jgi:CRISPR-associated Csh1 family protein